jgi:putative addiction module killer protein
MRYETDSTDIFDAWLASLARSLRTRMLSRLARVEEGNFGDHRQISENLFELRCFFGGGLRVYFTVRGGAVVLLLAGGDKDRQTHDIKTARQIMETLED